MVEMGAAGRADSGAYHRSLEIPEGEDLDLLQCLLASMVVGPLVFPAFCVETLGSGVVGGVGDRSAEDAGIIDALRGASPAFWPNDTDIGASRRDPFC